MKHFSPFRLVLVNECLWRKRERGPDERVCGELLIFDTNQQFATHRFSYVRPRITADSLLLIPIPKMNLPPKSSQHCASRMAHVSYDAAEGFRVNCIALYGGHQFSKWIASGRS